MLVLQDRGLEYGDRERAVESFVGGRDDDDETQINVIRCRLVVDVLSRLTTLSFSLSPSWDARLRRTGRRG